MSDRQELDFDVIQEPWNSYELEDGLILKTKMIAKRVFRIQDGAKGGYDLGSQNITVITHIPKEFMGKKAKRKLSQQEIASTVIRDDIRFSILREEWNEYVVEDGAKMRIKLTVVNISKTSQFNSEGEPIYMVNTSTMANIRPPKTYDDYEDSKSTK